MKKSTHVLSKIVPIFAKIVKNTHRENAPSNKTWELTKSMNMDTWIIGTLNQPFKKGSYTKLTFSKR